MKMTKHHHSFAAFSLIELLVVVAIIAIMAAAGAVALGDSSKSLRGAAAAASSVFGLARTEAIMRRVPARLIIDTGYNSAKPENYRRRMTVVVSTNGGTTWNQVTKWSSLPANAFFNSAMSKSHGQVTIAGLPGASGSGPYEYYEFSPNGQAAARAQFVLSRGVVNGGNFEETATSARAGFFLHKMGKPTFFSDPSDIPQP